MVAPGETRDAPLTLWQRLRATGEPEVRDALVQHYLPYAKTIAAATYARRTHNDVHFEEYMQLASLGLLESVDRFDPAQGVLFRTFSAKRIQGAILNGLVRLTEKNQQIAVRTRLRRERMEAIKEAARDAAQQAPAGTDGNARSPEELFRYLAEVGVGLALGTLLEGSGMVDAEAFQHTGHAASPEVAYFQQTQVRQLQQMVRDLLERLSPQQRDVIQRHYLQAHAFDDIARTMGLTRGRISQIHRQALSRLREAFAQDAHCDILL